MRRTEPRPDTQDEAASGPVEKATEGRRRAGLSRPGATLSAKMPRPAWWYVLAAGVLAAPLFLVGILVVVHRGEALPGVTVDGIRVGGLGREAVRARLEQVMTSRQSEPIVFVHGEREFGFSPGAQTYEAQIDDGVAAAFQAGRTGSPPADAWAHIAALWQRPIDVHLPDHVTLEPVRRWVHEVADTLDRDPLPGRVGADARTAEVIAELPRAGARVRREEAVEAALAAVKTDGPDRVPLPVDVIPQRVPDAEVHRLAAVAERALAAPLILTAGRVQVVLPPAKIARLISSRVVPGDHETDSLALDVTLAAVEDVFAPEADRINIEPRDATFDVLSPPVMFDAKGDATWAPQPAQLRLVPSSTGVRLDPRRTEAQLERLFVEGRRRAELEVEVVHPELTTEQAQSFGITRLIGTFTTHH
ncbi:MAG: hypothetical protein M3133_06310 [Actinomycetota bacterium]|nr:hypothetical protein [Actinomycetota bacterium]